MDHIYDQAAVMGLPYPVYYMPDKANICAYYLCIPLCNFLTDIGRCHGTYGDDFVSSFNFQAAGKIMTERTISEQPVCILDQLLFFNRE